MMPKGQEYITKEWAKAQQILNIQEQQQQQNKQNQNHRYNTTKNKITNIKRRQKLKGYKLEFPNRVPAKKQY